MSKTGIVYYKDSLAGYLRETDEGYEFRYDSTYLQSSIARPVSLTLPLSAGIYKSKVLFPFFDGLIPEGWLLDMTASYWKVRANDRFQLLLVACRDAIGAVSIVPQPEN